MRLSLFLLLSLLGVQLIAQSPWSDFIETTDQKSSKERWITPQKYRALNLDRARLEKTLGQLSNKAVGDQVEIEIPLPDGSSDIFIVHETAVMAPALAAKFPEIKTYRGTSKTRPEERITMDLTPAGFHGMLSTSEGTVYIDPYFKKDDSKYVAYYKMDYAADMSMRWSCGVVSPVSDASVNKKKRLSHKMMAAIQMTTYRLAVSATGEYTVFHGGTVASGQAAIVTAINRVNEIYTQELAVTLQLVANNDQLVFTDAVNDGFTNDNSSALLTENQAKLDAVIGNANYDVGHNFGTGGGGLAGLGVVCFDTQKAEGQTGLGSPINDPFYIDFVSHELGHQFGGNHTFNGSIGSCAGDNRSGTTAYEPGSASTIQGYAGICADDNGNQNLQNNSDPYFHLVSLNEMRALVVGTTCGTQTGATNMTPTSNANTQNINGKNIPANTPFELTGSGSDPDGDGLSYCWEQWDLGPQGNIDAASTSAPIFRSFNPTGSPTRIFPKLSDILNNTPSYGEVLPSVGRTLTFQLTVRDDNLVGAYDADMITLTVVGNTGPFKINSPNTASAESGATNITWDIAGTNEAPINCTTVDVFLSTDGGQTFPTTIATNLPNTGSATVTLPNVTTSTARLKIKCSDNVFFDINDANFSISPGSGPVCSISSITVGGQTDCNTVDNTYTQQLTIAFSNPPASGSLLVNGQTFDIGTSPRTITLTGLTSNGAAVTVNASFSALGSCSLTAPNAFTAPTSCQMTGGGGCTDYAAGGLPADILDGQVYVSVVNVTQGGIITDVNIKNLIGTHSWVSDLLVELEHVTTGTRITLFDNKCTDQDDFNLNIDDAGAAFSCPLTGGNTFIPDSPLSAFNGEDAAGEWRLRVSDLGDGDEGVLQSWTLEICTSTGGSDPCAQSSLTVTDNPIPSGIYKAANSVSSMSTIPNGNNVVFRAKDSINLKPNFMTNSGGLFEAQIGDCN